MNNAGQKDRYNLHQFYPRVISKHNFLSTSLVTEDVFKVEQLEIRGLTRAILPDSTPKTLKLEEQNWIETLPKLDNVRMLLVAHRPKQEFLEAICKLKNLEELYFGGSAIEELGSIGQLQMLRRLKLDSFTRLKDLSPIRRLQHLTHLSIENSFKIENYEVIGQLSELIGLQLSGDCFAPRNLRINSLNPYTDLKKLKHLDLSSASVVDNSYEAILDMTRLERFDILVQIPKVMREKIKAGHKGLKAGFFVDWDYDNKRFYEGKEW